MESPTRRRYLSGIGIAAAYAAVGSVEADRGQSPTAGTWRQFGNGPTNTFHSGTATPPRTEPSRPWTYRDAGGIAPWASITVVEETAYVPFSYDRGSAGLHAVDVTNGERRWRYRW